MSTLSAFQLFVDLLGDLFVDPSRLELVHEVSHGSINAVVEEARLLDAGSPDGWKLVIVKTYRPSIVQTEAELQEFVEESKRIHALADHKHIQRLIGVGCFRNSSRREIASSLFIVEEITGNWTLFKMLRTRKLQPEHPHTQWSQEVALGWCIEIAEGLSFLHNNGIVHRDLKPENITMTDTEVFLTEARIADLKPIRRNFRKNAHLHSSPEVIPSHLLPGVMLPDGPEVRASSIEDYHESPEAMKEAMVHDHDPKHDCQCSLLEYHRTKSTSLEVQNSLGLQTSISIPSEAAALQTQPSLTDKADLLGHHLSSAIASALPSLTASPLPMASPINMFKSASLPRICSHERPMYSPNASDVGGLKSPSGRKNIVSSSSASVNLGQEKWSKVHAAAFLDDEEDEEAEEGGDAALGGLTSNSAMLNRKSKSYTRASEPKAEESNGTARIMSMPATLPPIGHRSPALRKEGAPPRRANLKVRFDRNFGNSEGLAPAEDYSLIYAAPEYIRNMTWTGLKTMTTKSDVFAFAVLLYETLSATLICPARSLGEKGREGWHTTSAILADYAFKVSKGFREEIPDRWPQPLKSLIAQCWSQDPDVRPGMNFVLKKLKEIRDLSNVYDSLQPIHVHKDIEIDLEEIQMLEEEEERQRKRDRKRLKRREKRMKSGQPRPSLTSLDDDDDDEDCDDDDLETEHRPSLLQRISNHLSPSLQGSSVMFGRTSAAGPNIGRKGSHNSAISPSALANGGLSPSELASNAQLERLMKARHDRILKGQQEGADQPKCGCTVS